MKNYKEYNERLSNLRKLVDRQEKLRSSLDELYRQRKELDRKTSALWDEMEVEQADVERLERLSLASVFYSVMGKKEEQLDKEKAEAAAAAMKYATAKNELYAVIEEITNAEGELNSIGNSHMEYDRVLSEKSEAIKAADPENAAKILQMEKEIADLQAQLREIGEALFVANSAYAITEELTSELNKAKNWNTFDVVSDGIIADFAKRDKLNKAQAMANELTNTLRRLNVELADVSVYMNLDFSMDSFLTFADFFFDGIFSSIAVGDKINSFLSQAYAAQSSVERVISLLEGKQSIAERSALRLEKALDEFIANL